MNREQDWVWIDSRMREIVRIRESLDEALAMLVGIDERVRNELAWLQAKANGEEDEARALERADLTLKTRLLPVITRIDAARFEDEQERKSAWWDAFYERLDFHTSALQDELQRRLAN